MVCSYESDDSVCDDLDALDMNFTVDFVGNF